MYFLSGFKPRPEGDAIFAVVDRATRQLVLEPCSKAIDSAGTAKLLMRSVFRRFGMPDSIVSDRGPQFASSFFRDLMKQLGTKVKLSTAHHPQTDGITERYNRVVIEALRSYMDTDEDDWVEKLPLVEFAINNTTHSGTGYTPFYLNMGRHPRIPSDYVAGATPDSPSVEDWRNDIKANLQLASDYLSNKQEKMAEQADRSLQLTTFQPGEFVLVSQAKIRSPEERAKFSTKLSARYIGPYEIIESLGSGNYRIKLPANIRAHDVINVEHFKKFSKPEGFEPDALWTDADGTYFSKSRLSTDTLSASARSATGTDTLTLWNFWFAGAATARTRTHGNQSPTLKSLLSQSSMSIGRARGGETDNNRRFVFSYDLTPYLDLNELNCGKTFGLGLV